MVQRADHQKWAIAAGAIIGAAWLALIVTLVVLLGLVVGLLLAVWGLSFVVLTVTVLCGALSKRRSRLRATEAEGAGAVPSPA